MKKIIISMFSILMVLSLFQTVHATTLLYDSVFNVNGDISGKRLNSLWQTGFDESGFDLGTGLGVITWTTSVVRDDYRVGAFFDIEIVEGTNTFFNEYGAAFGGTAPSGLSWEIDEPGYTTGDIYDHFLNNSLDGSNASSTNPDDVSFALAWNFDLGTDQAAMITWFLTDSSDNLPDFYLTQTDPDSSEIIYFYSTLVIDDTGSGNGGGSEPVPEPSTILLFGLGILGLARLGRKKVD